MNMDSTQKAWSMLLLAGVFEVGYALSVAGSQAFSKMNWTVAAVIFFLLTLYALSVALKVINVGIGYAVWAGIGAVGSAVFGTIIFDQVLNMEQAIWLAIIILGVVWLKLAGNEPQESDAASRSMA
jgi:quaternary ammonium compound-resistance protein SugE